MSRAGAKALCGWGLLGAIGLSCTPKEPAGRGGGAGAPESDAATSRGGGGLGTGGAAGASGGMGTGGGTGGGSSGAGAGQAGGGNTGSGAGGTGTGGSAGAVSTGGSAGRDAASETGSLPSDASAERTEASSPPGKTYVYASGYNPQITIFILDTIAGTLTPSGSVDATVPSPSYLAISPDKQYLYAANEAAGANSKVVAFKINAADGTLQKINEATTGGDGSPHLSVHPSGKWVLVAHYGSGHASTLMVNANGGVATPPVDVQRPAMSTSHQIFTDGTGSFAFVPNVNSNTVFQFRFDASTGKLTANGSIAGYPSGAGPRHLALHPTKNWAYSINETAITVSALTYDPASGTLANPVTVDSLPAGASRTGSGAHIIAHPSGQFVYASNRGHNSISIFNVDASTGHLTLSGNETGAGAIRTPRDFGMDPAGKFLIVANQESASLIVFQINAADGKLTRTDTKTTPGQPSFVGVVMLP